jgi:dihydrofolate reductase
MGTISVDLFITLDGVYQGPGGPDEDESGAFAHGGWQGHCLDDENGAVIGEGIEHMDALLLGRRTYDIFAAFWPYRGDEPIAVKFNAMPKFVVSRRLTEPAWEGTTALSDVAEVASLKERFEDIHVVGSGDLTRSLLEADLVDRLNLYVYPVALGQGKRLFDGDFGVPKAFTLAEPPRVFPSGAMLLVYAPAGEAVTGFDMSK